MRGCDYAGIRGKRFKIHVWLRAIMILDVLYVCYRTFKRAKHWQKKTEMD